MGFKLKLQPSGRPAGRPTGFGGPGAGPGPPPGDGHRHRKTVTGKSYLKTFGMVRGSFWPKLVKSMCFRPNGRHEQFRSVFFIGKSSGISPKALTRVRFVTDRGPAGPAARPAGPNWLFLDWDAPRSPGIPLQPDCRLNSVIGIMASKTGGCRGHQDRVRDPKRP